MNHEIHIRRCVNVQCRVETYHGSHMIPLSGCPVCLMPGAAYIENKKVELATKTRS